MLLGNNDYTYMARRAQIEEVFQKIVSEHQSDKFIFAECNLNTGTKLPEAMQKLAKALYSLKPLFVQFY
jgi:uracil phosphoribosyltransferase